MFLLGRVAPCWRMRGGLADDGLAGARFVVKNDAENKQGKFAIMA